MSRNEPRKMSGTLVIVITGAPATGKTTVGRRVAGVLGLPYLHKDGVKELLFDSLGWGDRSWSRQLSVVAMDLLFYLAEIQLKANRSFMIEGNFDPEQHAARFRDLFSAYPCVPFQILCTTDSQTLAQRIQWRATSGARHPGHLDQVLFQEFDASSPQMTYRALDIGGYTWELDTTGETAADLDAFLQAVRALGRDHRRYG